MHYSKLGNMESKLAGIVHVYEEISSLHFRYELEKCHKKKSYVAI